MDSRLDGIFRTVFQPAEKTDTWQGLKREEKTGDQPRKHAKNPETGNEPVFEDNMPLSLLSLQGFLKSLLTGQAQGAGSETASFHAVIPDFEEERKPPGGQAAVAASAYQSATASRSSGVQVNISDQQPINPDRSALSVTALGPEDIRQIHAILVDVDSLLSRGIYVVTLRKNGSFLQTLSASVRDAVEQVR